MAFGLNKVQLIGNLTATPALRYTQLGKVLTTIRIGCNSYTGTGDDGPTQRTEFVNVVIWGKRAEGLVKVVKKGTQVYVEGRLQTRFYDDKQGQKRYITEVVAREVGLLGRKPVQASEEPSAKETHDEPNLPFENEDAPF